MCFSYWTESLPDSTSISEKGGRITHSRAGAHAPSQSSCRAEGLASCPRARPTAGGPRPRCCGTQSTWQRSSRLLSLQSASAQLTSGRLVFGGVLGTVGCGAASRGPESVSGADTLLGRISKSHGWHRGEGGWNPCLPLPGLWGADPRLTPPHMENNQPWPGASVTGLRGARKRPERG